MAGTVRHANLESRKARARLKRGRQPHCRTVIAGRAHLCYQRWPGSEPGRWLLRQFVDRKYTVLEIGTADDISEADGVRVYSFDQAQAYALAHLDAPKAKRDRITVRQAWQLYSEAKRHEGKDLTFADQRVAAYVLPLLGDKIVAELTNERLRRWLAEMAASPALIRSPQGKQNYRPQPQGDEAVRRRRASANRVLTMLKAALNFAYDEGHVSNREAWGRRLKPFGAVDTPRARYLSIREAQRLINSCAPDFRQLVIGALQTGARYSELARLQVADFNPDAGNVAIRRSKSSKVRHIHLTDEGAGFFREATAGRAGNELIFTQSNGEPWGPSHQIRRMREGNERAKLKPPATFHSLRHTWASLSVMAGVPLVVVARNMGHVDTRMVERVYGHLARSYIAEEIRERAPRFGIEPRKKVVDMPKRR